jgi:molecular chaperone DnaK (HSP70)
VSEQRYAIGIDLGTTHSALSYVDLQASDGEKAERRACCRSRS